MDPERLKTMRNGHLSVQLQEAGVDLDLINQILKLKEVEALMKSGKVPKETYEQLVDGVLREKIIERKAEKAEGSPQQNTASSTKSRNGNMMKKIRSVIQISGRARGPRRRFNSRNSHSEKKVRSRVGSRDVRERKMTHELEEDRREILSDELLRLGVAKSGRPRWKKVKVTLYDDQIEYFVQGRRGEVKNKKVIHLSEDFFVSSEVNRNQMKQSLGFSGEEAKEISMPHSFLLSDLKEKFYFAAEDEVKKEFWVTMLVQTIRDLQAPVKFGAQTLREMGKSRRFADKYKTMKKKFYTDQIRKTMRVGKIEDFEEEKFEKEQEKWKRRGDKLARQSVARDFMRQEMEQAREALQQQEILKKQLADKEEALQQITQKYQQKETEWQEKYDSLLAQMRAEALQRNEERKEQQKKLEAEIRRLKQTTTNFSRGPNGSFADLSENEKFQEYEKKLKEYEAKLSALQSVLNVDVADLEWDGTLEDAERQMQELMPDLMSPDEAKQREAQAKFDQFDNLVRNHPDYKARELKKWEDWEEENRPKNLAALKEMKDKYVPEEIMHGISQKDLMQMTGIPAKTARRVMQNQIFRFFYMDKQLIAKLHIADLLNKYASQGLDIRETRAVYACLPDEFQMDSDKRKQQFKDNMRTRLHTLTKKEKENTLTPSEKLHNAYREKEVRRKVKPRPGGKPKPRVKKNKAFANKALALQALLEKRGGDSAPAAPAKKKLPPNGPEPGKKIKRQQSKNLNPNAAEFAVYFKMKKNGLPDGAIMNRMVKDGKDPGLWHKLQDIKKADEKGRARDDSFIDFPKVASTPTEEPVAVAPKTETVADAILKATRPATAPKDKETSKKVKRSQRGAWTVKQPESTRKHTKRKHDKRKHKKKSERTVKDKEAPNKQTRRAHNRKKTLSKTGRPSVRGSNAKDLVDKAKLDYANLKELGDSGVAKSLNLEYGKAKTEKQAIRKKKNAVDHSVKEMVDVILENGEFDSAEGGLKTMKFGALFDAYNSISDMLIGLLMKGKRQGYIKYRGDMLFKGIHDEIKITVIKEA